MAPGRAVAEKTFSHAERERRGITHSLTLRARFKRNSYTVRRREARRFRSFTCIFTPVSSRACKDVIPRAVLFCSRRKRIRREWRTTSCSARAIRDSSPARKSDLLLGADENEREKEEAYKMLANESAVLYPLLLDTIVRVGKSAGMSLSLSLSLLPRGAKVWGSYWITMFLFERTSWKGILEPFPPSVRIIVFPVPRRRPICILQTLHVYLTGIS